MTKKSHYAASKIRILENLEPVRLRPAMYVGDTGTDGLHHIVNEVIDNAVDEHLDGHVTIIGVKVDTEQQQISVADNGRGIPVSKHRKTKLPMLTAVLTKLHSGGKFGHGAYTSAVAGLHGIGVKATNALSEKFEAWTVQEGKTYHQAFARGEPTSKVRRVSKRKLKAGTVIEFQPDFSIFKKAKLNPDRIRRRLRAIAYLCPGLVLKYKVDDGEVERFQAKQGLADMLTELTKEHTVQHEPIVISNKVLDAVFVWTDKEGGESWTSFVNVTGTPDHGTHVAGAKKAIQRVLRAHIDSKLGKLKGEDLRDGLIAVVHAHVLEPEFRGQTKRSLQNQDIEEEVSKTVESALRRFAAANQETIKEIIERAVSLRDARKKFREQQKAIRGTKVKQGAKNILPGKLCEAPDCDADQRELFIVEGDSAFGTVKQARVTKRGGVHFQEVLPLRGKVMNAARKGGIDEVLKNVELANITQAIGTGIGPAFDLDKCRYRSIFLLMDADSDGRHIQALLLAFFAKHMSELIEDGRLFVVTSPLYMGVTPKERVYGNTIEEIKSQVSSEKKLRITRFKGLGESPAPDLRIYAMHPKSRVLCQVIWGGKKDKELVLKYMGLDVDARKELLGIID